MADESLLKARQWIEGLVADGIPEGRTLDYKQELPNDSWQSKVDFLCDVTSFANASGGDLLFGVEEELINRKRTGVPKDYVDLKIQSADETVRRLQHLIRDGIDPSLSVRIDPIDGLPKGMIIRVSVPASWAAPHMVTLYRNDLLKPQFYRRHNKENLPMDIDEIRSAFTLAESRIERLRRFRHDRIPQMTAPESLLPRIHPGTAKAVLHLLPISAADRSAGVDIKKLQAPGLHNLLCRSLIAHNWQEHRRVFNFDGFLTRIFDLSLSNTDPVQYVQVFRTGAVETVIRLARESSIDSLFEVTILRCIQDYITLQRELGAQLPLIMALTLLGAKEYVLIYRPKERGEVFAPNKFDRNEILLPECLLEDWNTPLAEVLRPAFDALYQSVGIPQSPNYDENGRWIGEAYLK